MSRQPRPADVPAAGTTAPGGRRQPVLEGGEVHRLHQPRRGEDPADRVAGAAPGQQGAYAAETDREQAGEPADAEKAGRHRCRPVPDHERQPDDGDHQRQDPQRPRRLRADRITPASPPTAACRPRKTVMITRTMPASRANSPASAHTCGCATPGRVGAGTPEAAPAMIPAAPARAAEDGQDGDGDRRACPHSPRIAYPQRGDQGRPHLRGVADCTPGLQHRAHQDGGEPGSGGSAVSVPFLAAENQFPQTRSRSNEHRIAQAVHDKDRS